MSTASTAAAIGIKITVEEKQASEMLAQLGKKIDGVQKKTVSFRDGLSKLASEGLEKATFGLGKATEKYGAFVGTATWGTGLVTKGVGVAALTATAASVGLVAMATSFATGAATMGRSADRLGIPVEKLSEFGIAAHLAGSSAEAAQAGLAGLQATVADAAYGRNNEAFSAFRNAGIDAGDAKRGAADYAKMLPAIADETQRLARTNVNAAQRWLDMIGVGRELFPMLRNGAAGLKEYTDQADLLNPVTQEQAQKARELEKVMVGLEERFADFARVGGAAVAPGLTKMLDELGKFLAGHQGDVDHFFASIEKGIEWLITPQNMTWLHEGVDKVVEGVKHLYGLAESLEHNAIVRRLLGLPAEGYDESHGVLAPPGGPGTISPGNPDGPPDQSDHRTLFERLYKPGPGLFGGGSSGPGGAGGYRGSGPLNDPQSLDAHLQAAPPDQQKAARESYDFWKGKGFSDQGAAAMVAQEKVESRFNPTAVGDGGTAGGNFQWHQPRRDAILRATGIDVWHADHAHNLEAMYREMHDRLDAGAGRAFDRMQHSSSTQDASDSGVDDLERPRDRVGNKIARGALADGYLRLFQKEGAANAHDTAARRMATDAIAAPTTSAAAEPVYQPAADGKASALNITVTHENAPLGARLSVESDNADHHIEGPRVMGAMPDSGVRRDS